MRSTSPVRSILLFKSPHSSKITQHTPNVDNRISEICKVGRLPALWETAAPAPLPYLDTDDFCVDSRRITTAPIPVASQEIELALSHVFSRPPSLASLTPANKPSQLGAALTSLSASTWLYQGRRGCCAGKGCGAITRSCEPGCRRQRLGVWL